MSDSEILFTVTANTEAQVTAQGKEITDKNGVQRIEIDKLVTKIRVGDGNIRLKAPPSHTVTGKFVLGFSERVEDKFHH